MPMARLLSTLTLAILAGCRAAVPAGGEGGGQFQAEIAGRVAGPAQTCVSVLPDQNLRVIDSRTVAYRSGPTLWVSRLPAPCPGLSPYNSIIVERSGSQTCRGDRIRGLEPGGIIPGPVCNLSDWTPYRAR